MLGYGLAFANTAQKRAAEIKRLAEKGHPLIGIEPVVQAMESSEYGGHDAALSAVQSIDRFLEHEIAAGRIAKNTTPGDSGVWRLFSHCTEKASDPLSPQRWKTIFAHFRLNLEPSATGCCGMAGTFGHEREHAAMSEKLYDLSWRGPIAEAGGRALATGFSCRCQVKRFSGERAPHPVELLAATLARDPRSLRWR